MLLKYAGNSTQLQPLEALRSTEIYLNSSRSATLYNISGF